MSENSSVLDKLQVPIEVKKALRAFLTRVGEVLGRDVEIYLFGSFARGDWLKDSDLDLIVVSTKFRGLDLGKRYALVRNLLSFRVSVEMLLYTPEEFEEARKRSIVLKDAEEYWVKLR
ncbi:MAG: DNA polymerase III subunit beta [Thermoprotei archaeon]|nr:MAG: DNA polymerase III subunit beta [Thermoprotei archaeon]RLE81592.1 MAG: DNA polymerase III subunit beta [Thermoprotei archaeon]RLF00207.1 MAG: DNA polymerase III subunit beta [Thermoprotei archaeon]